MAEFNLGPLSLTSAVSNPTRTINLSNFEDTYSFSVTSDRNINLGVVGPESLTVQVFRDFNGNGVVDGVDKQIAINSNTRVNEAINLSAFASDVDPGSYVARVSREKQTVDFGISRPYSLKLSADAVNTPSKILAREHSFSPLFNNSRLQSFKGSVGDTDNTDTAMLAVLDKGSYRFELKDLTADADFRLIQDRNNNRIVDPGEAMTTSRRGGTRSEVFTRELEVGNYFLQASQVSGNANYTMTVAPVVI
jgi:hypothetical protein